MKVLIILNTFDVNLSDEGAWSIVCSSWQYNSYGQPLPYELLYQSGCPYIPSA